MKFVRKVINFAPALIERASKMEKIVYLVEGIPPQIVANVLDEEFSIMARPGLHCAPLAHKTLGMLPDGTCRFGIGFSTGEADVECAVKAVRKIAANR